MGFLPDHYDFNGNFITQNRLESPLDDSDGFDPKPRHHPNDSLYDKRSSRHSNKVWSSHSQFGAVAPSPYLSYIGEPWSPVSVSPELDDDYSLASSTTSLSPNSDLDTFPGEPADDDDNFFSSPEASPGAESIYQHLERYPPHSSSPHEHNDYLDDDDDLSPLPFSPPSLPLHLLESPSIKNPSTYNPPIEPYNNNYYSFDYDSSTSIPCSPSRRRSTTLPELELEPTTFNADLFGLHKSIPSEDYPPLPDIDMDMPVTRWRSFPGCETDDDLIPMDLASKNYIPDPSASVPTTSPTGVRSLLLLDHDQNDRSDMPPPPLSPSPENFYLDPTVLAECGDEELQQVYELRQRTAKSEKWERERCRELSALLRLKLDERGVLGGGGEGGDHHHQSGSHSLSCCPDSPFSSSPSSSDPLTVYHHLPQPSSPSYSSTSSPSLVSSSSSSENTNLVPIPSSSSSSSPSPTLPSTLDYPHAQSQGSKHKIRSMAQLVASMLFHRQSDALRRHPSRKAGGLDSTCSSSSYSHPHPSTMGDAGKKVLSKRRSRLSTVILPEELEMDSEEEEEVEDEDEEERRRVEVGETTGKNEDRQEEEEEEGMDLDDGSLSRSCSDMDLDGEKGRCQSQMGNLNSNNNSHNVTWAVSAL